MVNLRAIYLPLITKFTPPLLQSLQRENNVYGLKYISLWNIFTHIYISILFISDRLPQCFNIIFCFVFTIIINDTKLREDINWKKTFSFGHCPNYLKKNPPPWPQFGQLGPLFSEVKIQDLKVSLELKILYILYDILYICNLKKSYIGIFEEIDSFYWPRIDIEIREELSKI